MAGNLDYFVNIDFKSVNKEDLANMRNELKALGDQVKRSKDQLRELDQGVRQYTNGAIRSFNELRNVVGKNNDELSKMESLLGRVGGRIGGAEILGKALGIPGGGFIGSQLAYGLQGVLGSTGILAVGAAAGGAAALYGLDQLASTASKAAQDVYNLAKETATSVETIQELGKVSEITGVKATSLTDALKQMSRELINNRQNSQGIVSGLSQLGLSPSEAFQSPERQLDDILGALKQINSEASRLRILREIFGESGTQFAPLIDNFQKLQSAIRDSGSVMSTDMVNKFKDLEEQSSLMSLHWEKIKNSIALAFATVKNWTEKGLYETTGTPQASSFWSDFFRGLGGGLAAGRTVGKEKGNVDFPLIGSGNSGISFPFQGLTLNPFASVPGAPSLPNQFLTGYTLPEIAGERRKATADSIRSSIGTLTDQAVAKVGLTRKQLDQALGEYEESGQYSIGGKQFYGPEGLRSLASQLTGEKGAVETARKRERLAEFISRPIGSGKEALEKSRELVEQFSELSGTPEFRTYWNTLHTASVLYLQNEARNTAGKLIGQFGDIGTGFESNVDAGREILKNREFQDRERARQARDVEQDFSLNYSAIEPSGQLSLARSGLAFSGGFSRYGLTPQQVSRLELQRSLSQIGLQGGNRLDTLTQQIISKQGEATALQSLDPERAAKALQDANDKDIERKKEQIDIQEKVNDALGKFRDSVEEASEKVKDQLAGDFTNVLLGMQKGAYRGRAGSAAKNALLSVGEGIEGTFLKNSIGQLLDTLGITGKHGGVLSKIGGALPPWLTKGTILQPVDPSMTTAQGIDKSSKMETIVELLRGISQGGSGRYSTGTLSIPGVGPVTIPIPSGGGGGGVSSDISVLTGQASAIAQIAGNPTLASAISAAGGLAKVLSGIKNAVSTPVGTNLSSGKLGDTLTGVGQIAGAGIGAAEGIMAISRGGPQGVASGISGILGGASMLGGPAAPFLAAGSAVAGLVSALIGTGVEHRQKEINNALLTRTYIAPPALNLTASTGGTYSDVDFMGNVRTSNFSPYPVTAGGYLDLPRQTIIPGHTIGSFGGNGNGAPGAIVTPAPPISGPTTIHIHAMDSGSFVSFLNKNAGPLAQGVHNMLQSGHQTAIETTLASHLGLR